MGCVFNSVRAGKQIRLAEGTRTNTSEKREVYVTLQKSERYACFFDPFAIDT